MELFTNASFDGHEHVSFFHDEETGLKAIIAVHNTNLGPSLGGCRMWNYSDESDALTDVLRLSRGMSYKSALAGLKLGGGKSVIIGDPKTQKSPELFRAMGRFVDRLAGRYIIAEDVGTSVDDMVNIEKETEFVVGLPSKGTGEDASGDPSPVTAWGVFLGIRAAVSYRLGRHDLKGIRVAVQGLGHVGMALCGYLHEAGARLIVTDINHDALIYARNTYGAEVVAPDAIYEQDVDVFAPCALGGILNDETIPLLKASIVSGAANNQLLTPHHGDVLKNRNILYSPDFVINAGGVINVYYEWLNRHEPSARYTRDDVMKHLSVIEENLKKIYAIADQKDINTSQASEKLAEAIFKDGAAGDDSSAVA